MISANIGRFATAAFACAIWGWAAMASPTLAQELAALPDQSPDQQSQSGSPAPLVPWQSEATTRPIRQARTFHSGGVELKGTLHLPQRSLPVGAVVVTHAAASPLRTSPLYGHLTEMLPAMGIAVFVYDRRGAGESGGDLGTSDYDMLADDAIAAARMLSADPRIDGRRIGAWGLSQGGWLTLLAASRDPIIAYVVSIAAPVVTPDVQMMYRSVNVMTVNGHSLAEIDQMRAARQAVDDYMRGRGDRETAQSQIDAIRDLPWFKDLYMGRTVSDRETSRWRREIEHDPLSTLGTVRTPALVMFGAMDPVVPVAASVERMRALAAGRPNLQIAVVAHADHSMQIGVDPQYFLDTANVDTSAPNAPEYFGILAEWLTRQGATTLPDGQHP